MEFTACPDCGSIARVLDRFVLESTDGPVEHVRTQCVQRHGFLLPAASLVRPPAGSGSRPAESAQEAVRPGSRRRP